MLSLVLTFRSRLIISISKKNESIKNNNRGAITKAKQAEKNILPERIIYYFCRPLKQGKLSCGVIGNTSDFGSEEFRFEP